MTEAAHQMASNPLPPAPRFPGCVGIAAGPEVAIMDESGALMPPGGLGEVVIRGRNVTAGYENNPDANAKPHSPMAGSAPATRGCIDADGYLRLTGRLKELINRGGEKISPLEVDDGDHGPSRRGAGASPSAVPHDKLGEEVAAAVVLREGSPRRTASCGPSVGARLAPFKVPRKFVFLTEIPKGATGKLQRIGLAEKLGLTAMKVAIFGAGAIGGFLGVRLARQGADVTFIARGPHLAAMQANGLTLRQRAATASLCGRAASRSAEEAGRAGLCGRHPESERAAGGRAGDRHADGAGNRAGHRHQWRALLVFLWPGQPVPRPAWWKASIRAGAVERRCRRRRPSAAWSIRRPKSSSPGVIEHTYGNRFTLGEPDGAKAPGSRRCRRAAQAGLKAPVRTKYPRRDCGSSCGATWPSTRSRR